MDFAESPTPEDLIVQEVPAGNGWTIVREVGKRGFVIYEYRVKEHPPDGEWVVATFTPDESQSLDFLLARLKELDERCEQMQAEKPTPIELGDWRWNRKRAARRLRRFIREKDVRTLEIPQHMHALVERVLAEGPDVEINYNSFNWMEKLFRDGEIDDVLHYERRKQERPILIVTELDDALRSLLTEANETYFHGLFRATVALCRAVLEDVVKRVVQVQEIRAIRDDFDVLINCIPPALWSPKAKEVAHTIRLKGNDAMHDSEVSFSEDEAWRILVRATELIRLLINRGGLQRRQNP